MAASLVLVIVLAIFAAEVAFGLWIGR